MLSDITSFRVFGQVIVVLNSVKVAKDLFEKMEISVLTVLPFRSDVSGLNSLVHDLG